MEGMSGQGCVYSRCGQARSRQPCHFFDRDPTNSSFNHVNTDSTLAHGVLLPSLITIRQYDCRGFGSGLKMRPILAIGTFFCLLSGYVCANTEKTIFLAPPSITLPKVSPNLEDLRLTTITPEHSSLRTRLPVSFPTTQKPAGNTSVYLLQDLTPGQRYEVRICWAATVSAP